MDVSVALNAPRKRDLKLFAGDEVTLNVIVYAVDGDNSPVAATSVTMAVFPSDFTLPIGSQFTVPTSWPGRHWYRITGKVSGVLTTLAYGWLIIQGGDETTTGGNDYGWRWPYGPPYYPAVW